MTQIDLPDDKVSGLKDAVRVLDGVKDIAICRLTAADVVRHALVQGDHQRLRALPLRKRKSKTDPSDSGPLPSEEELT